MENVVFTLTEQEANVIIGALAKQPFEVVAMLIQKLQTQAVKQQNDRNLMNSVSQVANQQVPQ